MTTTAEEIIKRLGLSPHPEGGHFAETYRHVDPAGGRGAGTAIYFLLQKGERSDWHRVDAAEIWHFYAGAPLLLATSSSPGKVVERTLGPDLRLGQLPQLIVEPNEWQSARSLGEYTLVGCTVSPAFLFEKFELAGAGFTPERA
jgi:uncharacterized protein